MVAKGPNTNMIGSTGMSDKSRNYLSLRWFFDGVGDTFNPNSIKASSAPAPMPTPSAASASAAAAYRAANPV